MDVTLNINLECRLYYISNITCHITKIPSSVIKTLKKVLIKKPNKEEYILIKYYRIINILTYLDNVVRKLVIIQILEFYKTKKKLYKS